MENSAGVSVVSSLVSRKAAVMKSLIPPMIGPPYRGERIWSWTLISIRASERDSSLCGTWRFISSPSKSALYGGQTEGWSLKVRKGRTLTKWAITDIL